MNFAKFVKSLFLQNTTGRLLLIILVSILVKRELANEAVNYDTEAKAYVMSSRQRVFREIVFLEISQNSQENTWTCLQFY